ncbi:DUF2383 domain-containing protein [Legionella dresdenensis]|uniref:DUF2383 domain-containing protein n=1 Tax=Legionella dresdenensis TaxID=450200 RepID=A0ABV8CFU3_9GAMM
MTTFVGNQEQFHDALYELCELDYDAAEAYEAAINRINNEYYKTRLAAFKQDHLRHIEEITNLLERHNLKAPAGPGPKQILTEGKVVFANIFGDSAILKAMLSNEIDTNIAYERLNNRQDKWIDAEDILLRGLHDEKRHKAWIEEALRQEEIVD